MSSTKLKSTHCTPTFRSQIKLLSITKPSHFPTSLLPYPPAFTLTSFMGNSCSRAADNQCYGPSTKPCSLPKEVTAPCKSTHRWKQLQHNHRCSATLPSQRSCTHTIPFCLLLSPPATTQPTGIEPLPKATLPALIGTGPWPALGRVSLKLPSHGSTVLCKILVCLWAAALSHRWESPRRQPDGYLPLKNRGNKAWLKYSYYFKNKY